MYRFIAAAALLAAASGCEPSWSIRGQVASQAVTARSAGDDASATPIAQATVTLRCPGAKGSSVERTAVTDRLGWFEFSGNGPGPVLACDVVAQAPGHAESVTPLDEACADDGDGDGRCLSATMLSRLEKQR